MESSTPTSPSVLMSDAPPTSEAATVTPISTIGLFKSKGKKRNANTNIKQTATQMFDDGEEMNLGQPNASKPSSSSTAAASTDDGAEGPSTAGLSAAAIREEREKRKREKRIKQMEEVAKRDKSEGVPQPAVPISNASGGTSYSKEALAELRKNTKSFQPQPSTTAENTAESGITQDISIDLDDDMQVNLAALPSSSSSLDLPISSSAFRSSSHAKHQQLQDADDLKRIQRKLDTAISTSSQDDLKRERELEKLAEERMIRAAKLKRQQMRDHGSTDSMDVDYGESGSHSLQLHTGKSSLASTVLDKPYAVAVRTVDEENDGVDARLLREDADDAMIHEFDDEERGLRQGQAAGDRLKFGDPASGRVSKKQEIGSLFNASSTAAAKKKRGDAIRTALQANDEMDDDEEDGFDLEDDETKAWEQEMIKKGGGTSSNASGSTTAKSKATRASAQANLSADAQSLSQQIDSSLASAAASMGIVASLVDPIDLLYQSIDTQLHSMRVSHNKLNNKFHQLEQAIITEQKANHQLKDKLDDQNNSFVFYQELSENLITAFDCLSEKSRDIDAADNELRAMKFARKKEVDARILEHETELWNESGLGSESDASMETSEPQVDEFGRDIGFVHDSERVRRKDMRTEWFSKQANLIRDARTNKDKATTLPIQIKLNSKERKADGLDALGAESLRNLVVSKADLGSSRYDEAVSSLLADTTHIFADTAPTFRTMTAMKGWLEDWKRKYRSTYMEAYMPDSTAIIFAPYVKLELLQTWNLLQQPHFSEPPPRTNSTDAQPVGWYQQLFDYGMESDSSDMKTAESEEGDDSKLLPTLIQQILIPQVTAFVELEFDPFAIHSHVGSLKSCMLEIEAHLIGEPSKVTQWQTLRSTLLRVYQKEIQQHIEMFSVFPVMDPTAAPSLQRLNQSTYCAYRFHRASSLLESLINFQSLLDSTTVRSQSMQLVIQALLPFLAWKIGEAKAFLTNTTQGQQGWNNIVVDDKASSLVIATQSIRVDPLSEFYGFGQQLIRVFPSSWLNASSGSAEVNQLKIVFALFQQLQQIRETQSREPIVEILNRLNDSLRR